MNNRRILFAAAVCAAGITLNPGVGLAHHTNLSCAGPGLVAVNNSEGIPMTFDSNQGDDDVPIGPHGTVNIGYDGGDLIITGTWSNGVTNVSTFNGNCGTTTTTTVVETTTSTTEATTSTSTTTSTTAPPTTAPATTTSTTVVNDSTTTSILPDQSSTTTSPTTSSSVASTSTSSTLPDTTTLPSTTQPVSSSTTPSSSTPTPSTGPTPTTTPNSGDCSSTPSTPSPATPTTATPSTNCERPSLPATGNSDVTGAIVWAGLFVTAGLIIIRICGKAIER